MKLDVKGTQFLQPLFEFSGACTGCGETPYVKLMTQLFGDRLLIANATGCSSIYGGNLPTTPYAVDGCGRGPAWSNSLFEDNAEFGFGYRLSVDQHQLQAVALLKSLATAIGESLVDALLTADQSTEAGIAAQRQRVVELRQRLASQNDEAARALSQIADYLVRKSVWIVGGDGWAYDIGYGGLDHVLAMGRDVNILVLDTEVYSNTGGQQSKATPMGAAAKFAMAGKGQRKKDLALMAMAYGHVYVANVAFGARDAQTVKAFLDAESYPGPSLIIAYSHCIAHGYDMAYGLDQQKLAVESGYWPLFRYDPRFAKRGESPLKLDSAAPKGDVATFHAERNALPARRAAEPRAVPRPARADAGRHQGPLPPLRGAGDAARASRRGRGAQDARVDTSIFPGRHVMNLTTTYLGITLPHPVMIGASPLVDRLDLVRQLEDAGAAALTMHSLFEEQILLEQGATAHHLEESANTSAEALAYFPGASDYSMGPDDYLEHIRRVKATVDIPVIASLNGSTPGGWVEYARLIEQAGADALELNVYFLATDLAESGATVEQRVVSIAASVKEVVGIPVAVKLSPFFSSLCASRAHPRLRPASTAWSCSTASISRISTPSSSRSRRAFTCRIRTTCCSGFGGSPSSVAA